MNRRLLSFALVALFAVVMVAGLQEVSAAHTAQNLTITAGSGGWVAGGYNFNSSYMNKASFRPFQAKSAVSFVIWIRPDIVPVGADDVIFTQYVDSNNRIQLTDKIGGQVEFRIGNSTTNQLALSVSSTSANSLYMVAGAWAASNNLGKVDVFLNGTKTTGSSGIKGTISANADFNLGRHTSGYYYDGKIYFFAIYDFKLTQSHINRLLASGPDTLLGNESYYYTLNSVSGTTAYDWDDAWWPAQTFNLDAVTAELMWWTVENMTLDLYGLVQGWRAVQYVLLDLWTHSIIPGVQDSWFYVLILAALGAIICFAIMASMISDGDYDPQVLGILLLLGLFALLIAAGVILTV